MNIKNVLLLGVAVSSMLVACDDHPAFKTSTDAVEGCQQELASLKKKNDLSIEKLAKATSHWLEVQDSAYSVFGRDSTIVGVRSPVAVAFFVISDSIRGEITRIAFSRKRSMRDVMFLKLNTASGRDKVRNSDTYKEAVDFYNSLDKRPLYPNLSSTLVAYTRLLGSVKRFRKGDELMTFISDEDRCFRSLMKYLSQVQNRDLQRLTDATADVFDGLYSTVGNRTDNVNDRTMLYLTMRFNRRVVQNALACREDIEKNKRLDRVQRANYRWMLIQPFMAIDDYSTTVLTDEQRGELLDMANELPSLLGKLEITRQTQEQENKFASVLSDYFLNNYLSTSL